MAIKKIIFTNFCRVPNNIAHRYVLYIHLYILFITFTHNPITLRILISILLLGAHAHKLSRCCFRLYFRLRAEQNLVCLYSPFSRHNKKFRLFFYTIYLIRLRLYALRSKFFLLLAYTHIYLGEFQYFIANSLFVLLLLFISTLPILFCLTFRLFV